MSDIVERLLWNYPGLEPVPLNVEAATEIRRLRNALIEEGYANIEEIKHLRAERDKLLADNARLRSEFGVVREVRDE